MVTLSQTNLTMQESIPSVYTNVLGLFGPTKVVKYMNTQPRVTKDHDIPRPIQCMIDTMVKYGLVSTKPNICTYVKGRIQPSADIICVLTLIKCNGCLYIGSIPVEEGIHIVLSSSAIWEDQ